MTDDRYPPLYRSRPKRRNWRGWIIAVAAVVLLAAAMALAYDAESTRWAVQDGSYHIEADNGR